MAASPIRVCIRRAQPDSPVVHNSVPSSYLRHRVIAEEVYQARRRALRWQRAALAIIAGLFYLVIGRDLFALARGGKDNAAMEVRKGTQDLAASLSPASAAGKVTQGQKATAISIDSVSAVERLLAKQGDSNGLESLLSEDPAPPEAKGK